MSRPRPLPLVGRLLAARFLGDRRPILAGFKITNHCNLKCRACPFWRRTGPDMDMRGVVDTLDRLQHMGVQLLVVEGGEPFLWKDGRIGLEDVIEEARRRFYRVGITTNGTLQLESQADIVWVSIDGLKETHDALRGGSFDAIMGHLAASDHPRLFANLTINRANWREVPDLARFLSDRVRGITIQFYYPFPGTEDLSVTPKERATVLDGLIALKRTGLPICDSFAALNALKDNNWRCHSWLIASAEPDGRITQGCYLKSRAEIACERCGFAAHTEISLAYEGNLDALATAQRVFGLL